MSKFIDKLWKWIPAPKLSAATQRAADLEEMAKLAVEANETIVNRARRNERENSDLGKKFRMLFESNLIAMSFYDRDGHLIDLNRQMKTLCGFDSFGEDYFRQTTLFEAPTFKDEFTPGSREPFHACQHMYYPEIGIDRYIEARIRPTFDERGVLHYYIVTSRDVTDERKMYLQQVRHERELRELGEDINKYETELHYLLKNSNMFVWYIELEERRIVFTRSLSNREYSETIEEYIESLYEDERQHAGQLLTELLQQGKPFSVMHHFKYTPADSTPQWYQLNSTPVYDDEGRLVTLFGLARNVTELMNIQDQLRKESTRAEASGMMKSAFLANMTHEIRTPLNAIVGFSDLLQVVDEPADRQEFIRIISNNCDMLLRLINDILEASDMGQALAIEPANVDFAEVFNDICQTLAGRVDVPGVEFLQESPYTTYPTYLDKGRIQQVITNFVTNAVKYTREGHIRVGYREERRHDSNGLYIYCEDTGAGIPHDKQASVFERFVKLNDNVQGTGLGLSICKSIVERCGGQIGVKSEGLGHGSTFWMWIPCERKKRETWQQ